MNTPKRPRQRLSCRAIRRTVLTACIATALGACASVPAPTEQMAVSTAAVANAVSAGGTGLAPGELHGARDKLARANAALLAEDYPLARTLAEQSEVDAQLAVAKSRAAKAEIAARTLQEDGRVLREELDRKVQQ